MSDGFYFYPFTLAFGLPHDKTPTIPSVGYQFSGIDNIKGPEIGGLKVETCSSIIGNGWVGLPRLSPFPRGIGEGAGLVVNEIWAS